MGTVDQINESLFNQVDLRGLDILARNNQTGIAPFIPPITPYDPHSLLQIVDSGYTVPPSQALLSQSIQMRIDPKYVLREPFLFPSKLDQEESKAGRSLTFDPSFPSVGSELENVPISLWSRFLETRKIIRFSPSYESYTKILIPMPISLKHRHHVIFLACETLVNYEPNVFAPLRDKILRDKTIDKPGLIAMIIAGAGRLAASRHEPNADIYSTVVSKFENTLNDASQRATAVPRITAVVYSMFRDPSGNIISAIAVSRTWALVNWLLMPHTSNELENSIEYGFIMFNLAAMVTIGRPVSQNEYEQRRNSLVDTTKQFGSLAAEDLLATAESLFNSTAKVGTLVSNLTGSTGKLLSIFGQDIPALNALHDRARQAQSVGRAGVNLTQEMRNLADYFRTKFGLIFDISHDTTNAAENQAAIDSFVAQVETLNAQSTVVPVETLTTGEPNAPIVASLQETPLNLEVIPIPESFSGIVNRFTG